MAGFDSGIKLVDEPVCSTAIRTLEASNRTMDPAAPPVNGPPASQPVPPPITAQPPPASSAVPPPTTPGRGSRALLARRDRLALAQVRVRAWG